MMSTFSERVKEAFLAAESGSDVGHAPRYRAVLDEFASALVELGVGARVVAGPDPRRLALYLHALHRPRPATLALVVALSLETEEAVVGGPAGLEQWLLQFVCSSSFIHTLRALREEASRDVEARLRVSGELAYSPGDVVVRVGAEEQRRMAETAEGSEVTVEVDPGNGRLGPAGRWALLDSAGVVVAVERVELMGDDGARVRGRRV